MKIRVGRPFAVIAAAVCAVYASVLAGDLVCDGWPMVVQNEQLTSIRHLPDFFASGVWRNSSLQVPDASFFRPLFLVYLYPNFQAWGAHPIGYHVVSAAIHLMNGLLVVVIVRGRSNRTVLSQRWEALPIFSSLREERLPRGEHRLLPERAGARPATCRCLCRSRQQLLPEEGLRAGPW